MELNKLALAVFAAMAFSSPSHAQKLITIAQAKYPADQLLPGIEAQTKFLITVTAAGAIEGATVSETSGFPPLDQAALDSLMTAKFAPAMDKEGKPVAVKAIIPISFAASPSPVDRPCSGLNNEIAEFKRFNPAMAPEDLKSVAVIKGALATGLFSPGGTSTMTTRIMNLKTVSDEIFKQCAADPKSAIIDVIRNTTKKLNY